MYIVYNSLCRSISQRRNGGNVVFSAAITDIIVLLYKDNVANYVIFNEKFCGSGTSIQGIRLKRHALHLFLDI